MPLDIYKVYSLKSTDSLCFPYFLGTMETTSIFIASNNFQFCFDNDQWIYCESCEKFGETCREKVNHGAANESIFSLW